ncbi:MAG: type III pantothenate kinase [Bacteroidetes bacterium]|nr:type III pantothenate kinase [Bacteroidota bacterium]
MEKKFVIDVGNTLMKAALFRGVEAERTWVWEGDKYDSLLAVAEEMKPYAGLILSTVRELPEEVWEKIRTLGFFMELDEKTPLPIKNLYDTPATLGKDRLAAAVGGHRLYLGENVLIINAGTCITYDVVTSAGEYIGGSISPGLRMRLKALHTFTGRLPLLSPEPGYSFPGRNTRDSILSGALQGAIEEVKGMINRYRQSFPDIKVLLSGGDISFFENPLKSGIFVVPNIVLIGLNEILDYNV